MSDNNRYQTFEAFFPFYLSEHSDPINRAFHYVGTLSAVSLLIYVVFSMNAWLLLAVPIVGYGPAWIGHFIIEKNRPATFQYPSWSLRGDFVMLALFVTGRLRKAMPADEVPKP